MATIKHGTVRGYKSGCRCDLCTHANTKAKREERARRRAREGKPTTPRAPRAPRVPTGADTSPPSTGFGPIEAAARTALAAAGGDEAIAVMRREVAYRAAAVMDNPKAAPFFKSAADVLRTTVEDLLAGQPSKDGEADVLNKLMASLGGSRGNGRGRRGAPSVDDPEEPGAGDDR